MANQPIQYPNVDLPGAEYFSLAPNRTIALQGRRRFAFDSGFVTAAAATDSTNAFANQLLETSFTPTSAVYVHHFWANIAPTTAGLTVINVFCGLSLVSAGNGFPEFILGSPTLTNPTIQIGTALLTDRDRFVTQKDIAIVAQAAGVPNTSSLFLAAQLNVDNPSDAPVQFKIYGVIVYTRLDGVVE